MDTYKWGVLSDIHIDKDRIERLWKDIKNPAGRLATTKAYLTRKANEVVRAACVLRDEYGAQGFVLNGDLCDMVLIYHEYERNMQPHRELLHEDSRRSMKLYLETILSGIAELGLPMYVQPGSHESIAVYDETIRKVAAAYPHVIDVLHANGLSVKRFDSSLGNALVFVPGSDVLSGEGYELGGGYKIENKEAGNRIITRYATKGSVTSIDDEPFTPEVFEGRRGALAVHRIYRTDPRDLEKVVTDSERTIVFCHVPPRFEGNDAVDYTRSVFIKEAAEDGTISFGFSDAAPYEREAFRVHSRDPTRKKEYATYTDDQRKRISHDARLAITAGMLTRDKNMTRELRECNIGSEDLRKAYEGRVSIAINGHAHNSAGFAHRWDGDFVHERDAVRNLFWNASCLTRGYVGLLTEHKDGHTAYQNVDLHKHMRWPRDMEPFMRQPRKSALITQASGLTGGGIILPSEDDMRRVGVIPPGIKLPPGLKRR